MINTDVLIVGGGPAGSSCAWQLKQAGIDCLILDRTPFPRQKPCAGWITPEIFKLLQISPSEYPFSLTKFSNFKISIRGITFNLPTRQYAIRRWEFDDWMLRRSGVNLIEHQVKHIETRKEGYLVDGKYMTKFLVGAGGTHCPVQKAFFSEQHSSNKNALILAKEEEFPYQVQDKRCHLWFFEDGLPGYGWYVPKSGGYINVGIGGTHHGLRKRAVTLDQYWKKFLQKLSEMGLVKDHEFHPHGYSYYHRQHSLQLCHDNVFLVGDALGIATRDMGEGISPAVQSGLLAGDAIARGREYSIDSIPSYSFPSIIGLRKFLALIKPLS
jgi:flavin-dependent dehydrogenase